MIVIGSRGSALALWQAHYIQQQLANLGHESKIEIIQTQGDRLAGLTFDKLEGKGFFTKELEEALLNGSIDLAVHSHKDLPTAQSARLCIAAVSYRENPEDILLINPDAIDITQAFSLKKGAKVGTSSNRRKAQLHGFRPDLVLEDIRGNVPTRIQKLSDGDFHAIVLARAGIIRLQTDLTPFFVETISAQTIIPAPAQGVLALQTRSEDHDLHKKLQALHRPDVQSLLDVEREVLRLFQGGCELPLGVFCQKRADKYEVWTAKAEHANAFPQRLYVESGSTKGLAQRIVSHYQQKRKVIPKLFISRGLSSDSYFRRAVAPFVKNIDARSLIETKAVAAQIKTINLTQTDWIFFASKNAVQYFFDLQPVLPATIQIAVMGAGTAQALRVQGYVANFIGTSPDSKLVAASLLPLLKGKSVLFPEAKNAFQSIQKQLKDQIDATHLVVYETILNSNVALSDAAILIFTSPSNVQAYHLAGHRIEKEQQLIAIGTATAAALSELGYTNCLLPKSSNELGLSELVFALL